MSPTVSSRAINVVLGVSSFSTNLGGFFSALLQLGSLGITRTMDLSLERRSQKGVSAIVKRIYRSGLADWLYTGSSRSDYSDCGYLASFTIYTKDVE